MEFLDHLEFNPRRLVEYYRQKGWIFSSLPVITSYRRQEELREVVHYLLKKFQMSTITLSEKNEKNLPFSSDIYMIDVYILNGNVSITPVSGGYYFKKYQDGNEIVGEISFQNLKSVDHLIDKDITDINIVRIKLPKRNYVTVYESTFPLDYFIDDQEFSSKEDYLKYQEDLLLYADQEMKDYVPSEISSLIGEYLGGKTKRKAVKR